MSSILRDHAVVVLAAGSSSRLGQAKQQLRSHGETLLHRAVRLAAATSPAALVVVLAEPQRAWQQELTGLDHHLAINPAPQRGMAGSLLAAAPQVQAFERVLVMTCDQPALDGAHLVALLRGARAAVSGCAASALGNTLGVPAVVPGAWFAALAEGGRDRGFRERLRALLPAELIVLHSPGVEHDIDTPDDLQAARTLGLIDP